MQNAKCYKLEFGNIQKFEILKSKKIRELVLQWNAINNSENEFYGVTNSLIHKSTEYLHSNKHHQK